MKVKHIKIISGLFLALSLTACSQEMTHTHIDGINYLHKDLSEGREELYKTKEESKIGITVINTLNPDQIIEGTETQITESLAKKQSTFLLPVKFGSLSSLWGGRDDPFKKQASDWHAGIDFGASSTGKNASIFASLDGVVTSSKAIYKSNGLPGDRKGQRGTGLGNYVIIEHDLTAQGLGKVQTVYAHLETVTVSNKQEVKRGQSIGIIGNTGGSTSAHLHYEVRLDRDANWNQYKHLFPKKYASLSGGKGYESKGGWGSGKLAVPPLMFFDNISNDMRTKVMLNQ